MATVDTESAAERLSAALSVFPDVRLAFLFGSRARARHRADSDFDVAILLDESAAALDRGETVRRLAGRLGREVASQRLDLVILNDAPSLLRHRVLRDGIVLYQRSAEERVRFATTAIRDYQDGQIRRRRFTELRLRRLRAGAANGRSGDLLEEARGVARLLEQAQGVS